jgi:hypothetical protein
MTTHTRIKPLHLVAAGAVALVLAGGSATAGSLVTGAQIKNGTVTTKDVKDKSLKPADFAPGTLPAATPSTPSTPSTPEAVPAARAEGIATTCDSTGQLIDNSWSGVRLLWKRQVFDNGGIVGDTCGTSGEMTAPRAGVYLVTASIEWPSTEDTEMRTLAIRQAGMPYLAADRRLNVPHQPTQQSVSTLVRLTAGENVQVWAYHQAPAALTLNGDLSTSTATMHYVSE